MYSINWIFLNISVVILVLFISTGTADSNNSERHEILEFELKKRYDKNTNRRKRIKYGKYIWWGILNNSKWLPKADYPVINEIFEETYTGKEEIRFFSNEHF